MGETSDETILEQFRVADTRHLAFDLLVKKYQERLYWHIRRIVIDHEDANDLVQEVWVKIWHNLQKFRKDAQLYTWLYRIATNESLSFLKKKRRRFFVAMEDVEHELSDKLEADPELEGDAIARQLQKAVLKLPEKQRLVFNMRYYNEMKYEEMSAVLDTSVGALKASYHHAVKKIEEFLTRG